MGTTANHSLPYPENSDLVTNGAAAIQALAEAVDDDLGAIQSSSTPTVNGVALQADPGDNLVRWWLVGNMLFADWKLTFAAAPTTTISLVLPGGHQAHGATPAAAGQLHLAPHRVIGTASALKQNVGWRFGVAAMVDKTQVQLFSADGTFWNGSAPVAWANADELGVTIRVEVD